MSHPTPPSTIDLAIVAILSQQGQLLAQNSILVSNLNTTVSTLQLTTVTQDATAKDSLNEQINARELKCPHISLFPKFFNSDGEDFIQWYNDVLAILFPRE